MRVMTAPQVASVNPSRAAVGQTVILSGRHFSEDPAANLVLFGEATARVVKAAPGELHVELPEVPVPAGEEQRLPVRVRVGGRETPPVEVTVYRMPRIHGLSPDVAMPGEEVALAGTGWGPGAAVRFGTQAAEIVEAGASSIRVRVPPLEGPPGTSVGVTVTMANVTSNPAPFVIGRLPLIAGLEPETAEPGDVLTLTGRGFRIQPTENVVRVGGVPALLVSAESGQLKVVVPRVAADATQAPIEVRVSGSENTGQALLKLKPAGENVELRFVAEPFEDAPGQQHAVIATELGPLFVLSASGGRSAADRALDAQKRLNAAAVILKASRNDDVELRDAAARPTLALIGKPDALLEATDEDARGYNEDWTHLGGKGGPVTRTRLGRWWGALAPDLVRLLVRNEKPERAAAVAPEGRILGDLFADARKTPSFGLPRSVLAALKPPQRDALRLLGLRVPASVSEPEGASGGGGATPAQGAVAPLDLMGAWSGTETEEGRQQHVTVTFGKSGDMLGGTLSYGALSVPLLKVEDPQKDVVRFSVQFRGGIRYYTGHWDGQSISGSIALDRSGTPVVGSFTISQGR
jgi:hypothetical protein